MNSGYLNVIMCYVLVGISYPIAADAMYAIPVWTFISITFAIGFVFLYAIGLFSKAPKLFSLSMEAWGIISIQSLLGAVLYTAFLLYGFEYANAITASIFTSISPAFVLGLSFFILKEKLSVKKSAAIALAIAGVMFLTLPGIEAESGPSALGILFFFLSTLSVAGCVIAAKKLDIQLPAITMATGVCFTGTLFTLPVALLTETASIEPSLFSAENITIMVYYGLLVWAVPYFCFYKGVTRIPASATGMAFATIPVASTFCSIMFFDQSMSTTDIIALIMVTSSIFLAEAEEPVAVNNKLDFA